MINSIHFLQKKIMQNLFLFKEEKLTFKRYRSFKISKPTFGGVYFFFQIVSGSLSESADSLLRNISKQTKNNNDHGVTQVFFFNILY